MAAGGGLKQRGTMKQYDDDMMTKIDCAKRSDNKQIKALTSHVVAQCQELSSLKATVVQNHDIQQHSSRIFFVSHQVHVVVVVVVVQQLLPY